MMVIIVLVMGSMYTGLATPTRRPASARWARW